MFIAPCVVTTNDNFMGRTERRHELDQGPDDPPRRAHRRRRDPLSRRRDRRGGVRRRRRGRDEGRPRAEDRRRQPGARAARRAGRRAALEAKFRGSRGFQRGRGRLASKRPMPVQRALLLLADIVGYTTFMRLHRINLAHSQDITQRLLEAMVDAVPSLRLVEIEGDAVFSVRAGTKRSSSSFRSRCTGPSMRASSGWSRGTCARARPASRSARSASSSSPTSARSQRRRSRSGRSSSASTSSRLTGC